MKKVVIAALLSAFVAAPVLAADTSKISVGASYGLGTYAGSSGVLSGRIDYDISDMAGNNPVKARIGFDHYSQDLGGFGMGTVTWSTNVFYGGAYYDFNKQLKLDAKIHPFAGLGFGFGSTSCSGATWCSVASSPSVGGLYWIGGVQYNVARNIDAELGYTAFSGISFGANFKF